MNNFVNITVIASLIVLLWYCFNFNEIEEFIKIQELEPMYKCSDVDLWENSNRLLYENKKLIDRINSMEKYIKEIESVKNNNQYKKEDDERKSETISED
ncbi:MAG: hypothetical protein Ct9H90mP28_2450 [Paracoccaceae bacterium]|nr:MAG: hypothetical protein Ct9H90mP28_2450 [Paracoccaceae bacterium]|tara:strand:- start:312 stop:608 length:297 start_codon:yes stop_codon:yes gene_type:complete